MKKIQPAIIIGLGGTGVKTITFLKKMLQEQAADVAQFVRFLAVDIDELKGDTPSGTLFGENIRLDPEKNEFYRILDQTRGPEAMNMPAISTWFPSEGYKYLPLTEGARQAKPIGRLGFFLVQDDLARRTHRLADRLVTPEAKHAFPRLEGSEINVYLVASICGGTGAGLFVDFAYELRYLQQQKVLPEKSRIKGLFALGDVYDAVSNRVLANTYASLRELNWIQREDAEFHPVYPNATRGVIKSRAFDAIYLFGNSNSSDISFGSPNDFAHLCAEFIFLDSGADALQNGGDPLSAMMQSMRNNAEVYTMNQDADGTPRCFSSLGLCKIRFPADRVADLCAARMAREIIEHHILGRLSQPEILEARRKVQEFIATEGFGCDDERSELPDRLVEKEAERGDRITLSQWVTQALAKAYNHDLDNMGALQVGRFKQIVDTLHGELKQVQDDSPHRVVDELQAFRRILEQAIAKMFQENLGVSFVGKFLDELLESVRTSRDYAQQELKNLLGHEKRLTDQMNNHIREMANLLDRGLFGILKKEARRAQLKETYKAIRQYFLNRIDALKMRAAISFYDGVYDARQHLMEGGVGSLSILSEMVTNISLIQAFVGNMAQTFKSAHEEKKRIQSSPFEILIYDNQNFSELDTIFSNVYTDSLRAKLFEEVLQKIGGSIWDLRAMIDSPGAAARLRDDLMRISKPPFLHEIDKKTVAQRIIAAKSDVANPRDYGPNLQGAYQVANYFCRLNDVAGRFADLRSSEQSVTCVVAFQDESDAAWREVQKILREGVGRAGQHLPFAHTADRHSILIYREYCGFPAYTLSRITAYQSHYVSESTRDNTPPLQMLTKESLDHINVPNSRVLSKYQVLAIEALALGVILCDGEEGYFVVTRDEWKRRMLAMEAQRKGRPAALEDRMAGSQRKLGSRLGEVISQLGERLPDSARLFAEMEIWEDQVRHEVAQRKKAINPEILCDLLEALYFEGYEATRLEKVDLDTDVRPSVTFLLRRDLHLNKEHIFRPSKSFAELQREIHFGGETAAA